MLNRGRSLNRTPDGVRCKPDRAHPSAPCECSVIITGLGWFTNELILKYCVNKRYNFPLNNKSHDQDTLADLIDHI